MENKTDIKVLLGRRIKELRIQKKLTQEQLAEMIGVGERNLSKIECGNNFVTSVTLSRILTALEVEPSELLSYCNTFKWGKFTVKIYFSGRFFKV